MLSSMNYGNLASLDMIFGNGFAGSEFSDSVDEYPKNFDSSCHATTIMSELEKDRKGEQEFCDATISTESRNFVVHKCVVAAASVFFRKLFSSKMKEKYESKATIMSVSSETMELILNYIYTSKLALNDENVYDLLCAADYLQMQDVKDMCGFYLRDNLTSKNCFIMWNFAKMYNMKNLTFLTEMFISAHFNDLLKLEVYKELSPNSFKEYLALKNNKATEIDIYNAVINWVQYDLPNRQEHLQEIFSRVNLSQIPIEFFTTTLCKESILYSSPGCAKLLIDMLCEQVSGPKEEVAQELLIVGGTPSEQEVLKLNVKTRDLTHYPNMPGGRSGASAVVIDDQLFVIGGNCWSTDTSKSFNSMISFNLKEPTGAWTIMQQTMKKPRRCAGCAVLDGYIYMCGGKSHNTMWLSSCERFHISSQTWYAISDMNHKRSEFGMVKQNDRLYAMGGCDRPHSFLSSVEVFDPNIGTWINSTSMNIPRARFAAAVYNDEIYVVGGEGETEYLDSVEMYCPDSGMWTFVSSLSEKRFNHAACALGNEIFVFGGNSRLEVYDCPKDEWNTKLFVSRKLGCALVAL